MNYYVLTERLILRALLPTDVDGLYELDSDPEVHRYVGNQPLKTKNQAAEVIRIIRQQYADNGIGRWAVTDRQTHAFIGWAGLRLMKETINNHTGYYDLGYRLIRKYWGRGIATEAARAAIAYAFNDLKTEQVFAIAAVSNIASNKVLQKAGMKLLEEFEYEGSQHYWYRITKWEYDNNQLFYTKL